MKRKAYLITVFVGLALALGVVGGAMAQDGGPVSQEGVGAQAALGTGFTYQGQLKSSGSPVNGSCTFGFGLWDSASGGVQLGVTQTVTTTVTNGLFTVALNDAAQFGGSAFSGGNARYLGIGVKCGSESNLTSLGRQVLNAAPYALYARNNWGLNGNSGTSASNFLGTTNNMTLTLAVSNTAALRLVPNASSPNVIGGYSGNSVSPGMYGATIGGGGTSGLANTVTGYYGTVGGGLYNGANGLYATVGGGHSNTASFYATVGGGDSNFAGNNYAIVGGGYSNTASGLFATVGGGDSNTASGDRATIGGGDGNTASNNYATVGGGYQNFASASFATVGGGAVNTASGYAATVAGGQNNIASGDYSFAAGQSAHALHAGAFVWSDASPTYITSTVSNQFLVRASGGITLYTNSTATTGARLSPGSGSWSSVSDRNLKANFAPVDGVVILNQLNLIPIQTWNYQAQDAAIRHIGPMAQDFYAAFNVGEDNTHITTIDADGVALAAIQGLYQVVQAKDAQITDLQARLSTQEQANADLQARVAALEQQSGKPVAIHSPPTPLPWGWLLFGGLLLVNLGFLLGWTVKKGVRS